MMNTKNNYRENMVRAEAIDLGLSVKWASCNVGALSPEDEGGLYAWGEIEEKEEYTLDNYKFLNSYCDQYLINDRNPVNCNDPDIICFQECVIDFDITDDIAGTEFDVARVKWGFPWRMPRISELEELYINCSIDEDIISGVKFTGRNGNSIILPHGMYWSSIEEKGKDKAECFDVDILYNFWRSSSEYRECGLLIRSVFDLRDFH